MISSQARRVEMIIEYKDLIFEEIRVNWKKSTKEDSEKYKLALDRARRIHFRYGQK
jgi:hypothetical protein